MSEVLPIAVLAERIGFRADTRFAPARVSPGVPEPEPEDPLARAWTDGYAAGTDAASAEAEMLKQESAAARDRLELAFARLDREMAETLRQRLHDTVAALCEAAITPLALDEAALAARVERAVAMFVRADDERVIRLHPDDIPLVSHQLKTDCQIMPDPSLERGALRVETASGGVEDGPAQWRQAIAEALHQ